MREFIILQRIKAGDPSGLEALMDLYVPYVSVIVWNILRNAMTPEDGEEVVSDVFLAAWNQAADLKSGYVKSWLGAVARNKAKNKLREAGKTLPLEESILDLPGADDPAYEIQQAEEQSLIRQAVDALPPREKQIMCMRLGLRGQPEHTQKQVADCIGISQSYISRLEKRIIRRLRQQLEQTI